MNSNRGLCRALLRCLVPLRARPFTEAGLPVSLLAGTHLVLQRNRVQFRLLAHPLILSSGEFRNLLMSLRKLPNSPCESTKPRQLLEVVMVMTDLVAGVRQFCGSAKMNTYTGGCY